MGNLTVKESGEMVNIISPNVNNITSFKVYFSPKQEGTGDPSPENVREIVGWSSVDGYKCGKNLFDYAHANILDVHIKNDNGVSVSDGGNSYCQIYIPVMPNTTYTLSGLSNEKNFAKRIYYYDEDKQWISRTSGSTKTSRTITTPSNCRYIQIQSERQEFQDWSTVQVELGDTATEFEPYKYGTVLMDWTDTIGNIYGGYVDLVSGVLVKEWQQVDAKDISWYLSSQNTVFKGGLPYPRETGDNYGFICERYKNVSAQISISNIQDLTIKGHTNSNQNVYIKDSRYTDDLTDFEKDLDFTFVYKLATPITHQLTPQQLSTLKGQNNFWSNADYVEIEYELTETFDIQKAKRKIILNQPHIESTSGTIAKPETDMIGKIKECKIHFMPVQQGDSDPTPDNIVPVTGWTGINIYQAFVEYPITPIVNTTEGYGVKWVVDKDGLMTAYGTPTAYTGANFGTINVNGNETLYGIVAGNLNNVTFNKPTLLNSNDKNVAYTASDGILQTGLDLSLYSDIKKVRISIKRSGNVFMSGSCNVIIWKDKKPTISTTTIDWTNEVGTIYGGYVDLISGELVVTQIIIKDKWGNWEQSGVLDNHIRKTYNFQYTVKGGNASQYCLSNVTSNYVWSNSQDTVHYYVSSTGRLAYMILPTDFDENTDVEVIGTLAEPIIYQLTPQQLTILRGINNIWSNANGEVEIKYWKH